MPVDSFCSPGLYSSHNRKSVVGIGVSDNITTHSRVCGFFCVKHCHIRIMVGRAGAEKSAPGFVMTGYANPVRLTTSLIGVRGGDHPINWSHHI
ncbi:ash family protein [Shigella sonnei]|uniref:ash family protein n=1 Tax=Shigella sonnei TaxID=624 RepID=UPI0020967549|nr:ash family protein [Shigella sonnei]